MSISYFNACSQGVPANLPKGAVKNLVKHQLKAHEPTVAALVQAKAQGIYAPLPPCLRQILLVTILA